MVCVTVGGAVDSPKIHEQKHENLKGLYPEMDLAFHDMYGWLVLGLHRGSSHFLSFLGAPMIL
jgi:hypothetical protein